MIKVMLKVFAPIMVACALAVGPLSAQAQPPSPSNPGSGEGGRTASNPAEKFVVSPGGVDLRTGSFIYNETDLVIGDKNGLSLTRTMIQATPEHINPFGTFSHNWDIMVDEMPYDIEGNGTKDDLRIMVRFGGRSETFESSAGSVGFEQVSQANRTRIDITGNKESSSSVYNFTDSDGTKIEFRPIGSSDQADCSSIHRCAYASKMIKPDGTVYTFDYEVGSGNNRARLRSVISTRGYALLFEGRDGLVDKACIVNLATTYILPSSKCPLSTNGVAYYTYSGSITVSNPFLRYFSLPILASVTNSDNKIARFMYDSTKKKLNFIKPQAVEPWMALELEFVMDDAESVTQIVTRQSYADGQYYQYQYGFSPNGKGPVGGSYVDAAGNGGSAEFGFPVKPGTGPGSPCYTRPCQPATIESIVYQQTSGPVLVTNSLGQEWKTDYCNPIALIKLPPQERNRCIVEGVQSYTDPEGIKTILTYGSGRNIIEIQRQFKPSSLNSDVSATGNIITKYSYECKSDACFSKPTSISDARGNVTNFVYDLNHGGVLIETGPSVDGIRPTKRFTYGQRYAWIRNGTGYIRASAPVWLLVEERTCLATAADGNACVGGAADEVITTYDYGLNNGPNNLLLREIAVTTKNQTRRACYGYDAAGNQVWKTNLRTDIISC